MRVEKVRAGVANTPETSDFTSGQDRVLAKQGRHQLAQASHLPEPRTSAQKDLIAQAQEDVARDHWLCPIQDDPATHRRGFLEMDLDHYLTLLDWSGRQVVEGKKGHIPAELEPMLRRLEIESGAWLASVQHFGSLFYRVTGTLGHLKEAAKRVGQKWFRGYKTSQKAFLTEP